MIDRATDLAPDTLAKIADSLPASGAAGRALTNRDATEFDRFHLHTLALRRDDLLLAGGLDESAYYGGALGGPHELARRLARRRYRLTEIGEVPPARDTGDTPAPGNSLECLTRELWPDRFSPLRGTAIRSNREILKQRAELT